MQVINKARSISESLRLIWIDTINTGIKLRSPRYSIVIIECNKKLRKRIMDIIITNINGKDISR